MFFSKLYIFKSIAFAFLLVLFCTRCGAAGAARESWTLVQLLTRGERSETRVEQVVVRNCGVPEVKTVECSAGTADSFSVQLGGSIGVSVGGELTFDPSLAAELGFDWGSGESLALPTPPEGYVAYYTIEKTYRLIVGEVLAHSNRGDEQNLQYAFQASCSQRVVEMGISPCDTAMGFPATSTIPPTDTPLAPTPTVVASPTPTLTPRAVILPANTPTPTPTPITPSAPTPEHPTSPPPTNDNVIVTPSEP